MGLRLGAGYPWHSFAHGTAIGPLEGLNLDTHMEDSTELQRRISVGQQPVQLLDALLLGHVVDVEDHLQGFGVFRRPHRRARRDGARALSGAGGRNLWWRLPRRGVVQPGEDHDAQLLQGQRWGSSPPSLDGSKHISPEARRGGYRTDL